MATTKTSAVVQARRMAREAKALADAERAEHDKKIENLTTSYYEAALRVDQLTAEIAAAQASADKAVAELLETGEPRSRIAVLTGLSDTDVSKARRRYSEQPADAVGADAVGVAN